MAYLLRMLPTAEFQRQFKRWTRMQPHTFNVVQWRLAFLMESFSIRALSTWVTWVLDNASMPSHSLKCLLAKLLHVMHEASGKRPASRASATGAKRI